jgi:micrococcal nuclease
MEAAKDGRLILSIVVAGIIIGAFHLASTVLTCECPSSGYISGPVGEVMVTRIIDGDTVVVEGGYHVRLLGMDADEKGSPCYAAARDRLGELVLDREVYLEADTQDTDQYDRYLRYLILDGGNVNLMMVQEGLAIARFYPENVKYREEITAAEKEAMDNRIGCKWSG